MAAIEFFLSFPISALAGIFFFLLFLYHFLPISSRSSHAEKKRIAPEAAGAWPLIGHLHKLAGPELPHVTLGTMADKLGPIFTIRLGLHRALVVSDWEIAKECFTTNDIIFSSRPKNIAVEQMGYDSMFGAATYGPYWLELRKLVMLELLSNHRLTTFNHIRESEVKSSIKKIYERLENNQSNNGDKKVAVLEMKKWIGSLTVNVICQIILGKRVENNENKESRPEIDQWRKALRDFFDLMGVFTVGDAVPFLRWLDIGGYEKAMKKTARKLDVVLQESLEEHKQRKASGQAKDERDFMDVMITILGDVAAEFGIDADTINKATCLNLLLAGNDTTTVTLTWAMASIVKNPHVLKKAQDEIDQHVGKERQVKESDIKNLVYLQAIMKETLRLYPATMLSPPREAMQDCIVGGYHVSAGTHLFFNLWRIHRDPRVWSDPQEFRPERFLTTHEEIDVRGQHYELIPFGSGRRVCPGISFALQVAELTLASLLHGFDIRAPSDDPIDMTPGSGFTNHKATPLKVLLSPRLSADLYG